MTQQVRAKFYVTGVFPFPAEGEKSQETVQLQAVTSGSEDDPNKSWSKWTPSGQLQMTITNPAVFGAFVEGEEYYLDFSPVRSAIVEPIADELRDQAEELGLK